MPGPGSGSGRGLRRIGAATLWIEAVVLVLAVVGLQGLRQGSRGPAMAAVGALALGCVLCALVQQRQRGPGLGLVLQLLVVAAGVLLWPLYALGLVFGALWVVYLRFLRGLATGALH
ncbi:MAG: DUF4233 domain-containing protein [Mycobacteriales bacterium]